jgi:hypothetical protein
MSRGIFNWLMEIFGRQRRHGPGNSLKAAPRQEDDKAASLASVGSTGGISGGSEGNPTRSPGGDMFGVGVGAASTGYVVGSEGAPDSGCGDSGTGDFAGGDSGGGDCGGGGS